MPTVLLTYELGSGLGHLNRLIALARRLPAGLRLIFAVPDLPLATPAITRALADRAEVVQGVTWPAPNDPAARQHATSSFADVLALFGFDQVARLDSRATLCTTLIDSVRPDLVVADFAPTMRLALPAAVPMLVVGTGFTVPPPGRALAPMRPWEDALPAASAAAEARTLGVVNAARERLGRPAFGHLADLFSAAQTFVCTIPELDPYAALRATPLCRPYNTPPTRLGPPGDARTGPVVFAYLPRSHPLFELALGALNDARRPAHLYVSGADPESLAGRCAPHIGLYRRPAELASVLPQVRLLIHHGGLGTAYAGAVAGTPQLLMPQHLEDLITAKGLGAAGVAQGFSVNAQPSRGALTEAITTMTGDGAWLDRARRLGQRLASPLGADPLAPILAACAEALASGQTA